MTLFGSRLGVDRVRGFKCTTEDAVAAWELRNLYMGLKPHVDPEENVRQFIESCRRADHVYFLRDASAAVRGFTLAEFKTHEHRGQRVLCLFPRYGFMHPDYRGDPSLAMAYAWILATTLRRAGRRPAYFFGGGYPLGYLRTRSSFPRTFVLADEEVSEWERSLLRDVSAADAGEDFDPATGLRVMATTPRSKVPPKPRRPEEQALLRRYLELNPNWHQGTTLMVAVPIGARELISVPRTVYQRWRIKKFRS